MIDYHKLIPKRGQLVLDWWTMVIRWAKTLPVILGPNMSAIQTPLGLKIKVQTSNAVSTNFAVSVTARRARITAGTVDEESPWIIEGRDEPIRLDGTRPDGTRATSSEIVLNLEDAKPNEDDESAIVVKLTLQDGQFAPPAEYPEGLQIVHLTEFGQTAKREAIEEGAGFQVLAKLRWSEGSIRRITQVVNHNLNASIDAEGRIFFSGL